MTLTRQLTTAMVSVALLTGIIVGGFVGVRVTDTLEPTELARLTKQLESAAAGMKAYMQGSRASTLVALHASSAATLGAASAAGQPLPEAEREEAMRIFHAILAANPHYLQLRLIAAGPEGRELIRVERAAAGQEVRALSRSELQPKGKRYYVTEALALERGEIYVSPIDLNQEHGQVAVPYVPVLRIGVPVYGNGKGPLAVVVLNVDMAPALNQLREELRSQTLATYLFDSRGNFLIHPDPRREFGLDLGTGEVLDRVFPQLTRLTQATEPWVGMLSGREAKATTHVALPFALRQGTRLVLLVEGVSAVNAARSAAWGAVLGAALVAVGLAMGAALLLSRALTRPLAVMTSLAQHYPSHQEAALPVDAPGEVGTLARALGQMDAQIRERNDQLEAQQARFQRMFESSPHAQLLVDKSQRISMANDRATSLFGYSRAEMEGQALEMLIPTAARAVHRGHVEGFFARPSSRAMAMGRTFEIENKSGATVHVEIALAALAADGETEVLASIVDVSRRVRSEQALRTSNQELEQFAYVASHDLQEPLRMVTNYTELIARRYEGKLDAKGTKYMAYVVDGARRMQRLISDLLAYSRVESQGRVFGRIDLNVTLKGVLDALQVAVQEAGAVVEVQPLPEVSADASQMHQLFQNLLDNAIKFRSEQAPRVVVSAMDEPGNREQVRITVRDNGIGIDMRSADRLFKMFQRGHARDRYPGTGIGLTVAQRVVQRHGGKIWVEPTPGGGTTFRLTLTLAPRGRTA